MLYWSWPKFLIFLLSVWQKLSASFMQIVIFRGVVYKVREHSIYVVHFIQKILSYKTVFYPELCRRDRSLEKGDNTVLASVSFVILFWWWSCCCAEFHSFILTCVMVQACLSEFFVCHLSIAVGDKKKCRLTFLIFLFIPQVFVWKYVHGFG